MRVSTSLFLLSLISLLSLVASQAVYNPGDIYVLDNIYNGTQNRDEGSSILRVAAKEEGHGSSTTDTTSTTSGKGSSSSAAAAAAAATTTTATTKKQGHGGGGKAGLAFASPAILTNGTLFYCALSVTCLLWVTGRLIDFQTDRLERFTEANVHKL